VCPTGVNGQLMGVGRMAYFTRNRGGEPWSE